MIYDIVFTLCESRTDIMSHGIRFRRTLRHFRNSQYVVIIPPPPPPPPASPPPPPPPLPKVSRMTAPLCST